MKELLEFIAKELVDDPDQVFVSTRRSGPNLYAQVTAREGDMGRLIGRNGRTAEAIRAVARVAAARQGLRITVDIE